MAPIRMTQDCDTQRASYAAATATPAAGLTYPKVAASTNIMPLVCDEAVGQPWGTAHQLHRRNDNESTGVIVGIIFGVVFFVVLIGVVFYFHASLKKSRGTTNRRRSSRSNEQGHERRSRRHFRRGHESSSHSTSTLAKDEAFIRRTQYQGALMRQEGNALPDWLKQYRSPRRVPSVPQPPARPPAPPPAVRVRFARNEMDAPRLAYSDNGIPDEYAAALEAWEAWLYDWAVFVINGEFMSVRKARHVVDEKLKETSWGRNRL